MILTITPFKPFVIPSEVIIHSLILTKDVETILPIHNLECINSKAQNPKPLHSVPFMAFHSKNKIKNNRQY